MLPTSHDPLELIRQLRQTLAADKLSVGFFLGAGCPCAVDGPSDGKDGFLPLIPDVRGLTDEIQKQISTNEKFAKSYERLVTDLVNDGNQSPVIEKILDRIRALRDVAGKSEARGFTFSVLDELDKAVCAQIKLVVSRNLPETRTPYHALAQFIGSHRFPASELFTTNYDLLMEQALEACRVPFFDGFLGAARPFFDQRAIEDDDIPPRWSRIWKLHGSINWRFHTATKSVIRSLLDSDGEELLIHPSHRKYDESRRMPYFVMIDRLRNFIVIVRSRLRCSSWDTHLGMNI
jgi:hypothetical protein